jgi:hypothetical protein
LVDGAGEEEEEDREEGAEGEPSAEPGRGGHGISIGVGKRGLSPLLLLAFYFNSLAEKGPVPFLGGLLF